MKLKQFKMKIQKNYPIHVSTSPFSPKIESKRTIELIESEPHEVQTTGERDGDQDRHTRRPTINVAIKIQNTTAFFNRSVPKGLAQHLLHS